MFKQMKQFEMKESTHKFYNTGSLEFMHGDGWIEVLLKILNGVEYYAWYD